MASSSSSWDYDVFISFRGEDTRKKFVDHLYSALQLRGIYTYKDDEKLPRGEVIGPSLFKAIRESRIVVIVFSKNYADSSWCLDELAYIMKCKEIIMPIFYDVDPSDVRQQNGEFGNAFKKQKLENTTKAESWRKALVDAGNLAGWEPKHIANGHEAKGINEIVDTISNKLFSLNSNSSEDEEGLVGMDTRVSRLISQLQFSSGGVRMVGIWGVGGGGKTTLASSVYMKISHNFEAGCIVDNIREESSKQGLKKLQENILLATLKTSVEVQSVEDGKKKIKSRLCHKKVLILLDDVDDRKQLEAFAGSHKWFGEGSRIIITTRNEHLLISHRVDEVSHINLLSHAEAIQLFNRYAYQENKHVEGYGTLSECMVSYAAGLPLALKVLGSFLYDKEKTEWLSTLARLEDNPEMEIVKTLKISYDGLTCLEQELFLDIACFFRGEEKDDAMLKLKACGFHPDIGIRVLIQKALITVTRGRFDMHDLVQEMGHYIVRGDHPNSPEKHSRVWKTREIDNMCSVNAIMLVSYKTEAIKYRGNSSRFPQLVSNMKKLRSLYVHRLEDISPEEPILLSNELRCIDFYGYPERLFPESFQPVKLVYLRLSGSLQKELWKGYKLLPCLKELHLFGSPNIVTTPDFGGFPSLCQFKIRFCRSLERIHPSLGNHRSLVYVDVRYNPKLEMFPTIVRMEKLQRLTIWYCGALCVFPEIQANMDSLVKLSLSRVGIEVLPSSIGKYCTNLIHLSLGFCQHLKRIEGNFYDLKHLQELTFPSYIQLEKMSQELFDDNCCLQKFKLRGKRQDSTFPRCLGFSHFPRFLTKLGLRRGNFQDGEIPSNIGELSNLQELDLSRNHFTRLDFSLTQLTQLKLLDLTRCERLVQLPGLPSSISVLLADHCTSLEAIGDIHTNCKWLCQVSFLRLFNVTDGGKLLQSMLQGEAIENHSMIFQLEGFEIPSECTPPLHKGTRYTLELPENWCNDFCGFLMCGTMSKFDYFRKEITMTHTKGMDSQPEFSNGSLINIAKSTWVVYFSFGLLRHTAWWDETSNAISFSNEPNSALGVRLILRKTVSVPLETTTDSSQFYYAKYGLAYKLQIKHDSKSSLQLKLEL